MFSYRAQILNLQLAILRTAIEAEKWVQGKDDPGWVTRGPDGRFGKSSGTQSSTVDDSNGSVKKSAASAATSPENDGKAMLEAPGSIDSMKKYFLDKLEESQKESEAGKSPEQKAVESLFQEIDATIKTKDIHKQSIVEEALLDAIERTTRINESSAISTAQKTKNNQKNIEKLENILGKNASDLQAEDVIQLIAFELAKISREKFFDPADEIAEVMADKETLSALKSQGIDSKEFLSAANRLANKSTTKTPREEYLRDRDLERYLKRATELKELAKSNASKKDPNAVRCRVMSIKSEIKNGAAIDEFLSKISGSDEGSDDEARKEFIKKVGNDKLVKVDCDYVNPINDDSFLGAAINQSFRARVPGSEKGIKELTRLYRTPISVTISLAGSGGFAMQNPERTNLKDTPDLIDGYKAFEIRGAKKEKDGFVNTGFIGDPKMIAMHETTHIFTAKNNLTPLLDSYADSRKIDDKISQITYTEINNPQEYDIRSDPNLSQSGAGTRNTDMSVPYAAKTYAATDGTQFNSEVLTVGVESLYSTKSLKSMSIHDREHLAFSLRVLQETTKPE